MSGAASLFSGIGGLDYGLCSALGLTPRLMVEWDPWRRDVLRRHNPRAEVLDDVRDAARIIGLGRLPLLMGGFPCRGASTANRQGAKGMEHAQTGLWSYYAKCIALWRPEVVIIENVTSLRARGLDQVLRDLAAHRYDAFWAPLTASALGAPHRRSRLFIVARRRGVGRTAVTVGACPPIADWTAPIPKNDHEDPSRRQRVGALGDAVVPVVGWHVGCRVAEVFNGWWPEPKATRDALPNWGMMLDGVVTGIRADPWGAPMLPAQRWVTIRPPGPAASWVTSPKVGRLYEPIDKRSDPSDCADVELPGGYAEPAPVGWLKPGWPTPTEHDGSELGSASTWERNSPPLSTLAQACPWKGAVDGWDGWAMLDEVSGQGDGPGLVEWAMGFPSGWTS